MDELAIAHVDADVAECAAHGVEEHQVAGLQVVFVNFLGGCSLLGGLAGQQQAGRLLVNGTHKTAAVKAGVCLGAAAFVRHAQKSHGVHYQLGGSRSHLVTHITNAGQKATVVDQPGDFVIVGSGGGGGFGSDEAEGEEQSKQQEKTHPRTLVGMCRCVK